MEKRQEIVSCLTKVVFLGHFGERDSGWKPFNRDAITGGLGGGDEDFVTAVVFEGGANVETIKSMLSKGAVSCTMTRVPGTARGVRLK